VSALHGGCGPPALPHSIAKPMSAAAEVCNWQWDWRSGIKLREKGLSAFWFRKVRPKMQPRHIPCSKAYSCAMTPCHAMYRTEKDAVWPFAEG
jgi:hypothetical protein